MSGKDFIYGTSIVLTFIIGVWNLVWNYRATRRANFINTVTSQRVKWIEQLRQDISSYSSLIFTWYISSLASESNRFERLNEIDRLSHAIRLRLNPDGAQDKKIERLMQEIQQFAKNFTPQELRSALESLTVTSQLLLKEEWEKVKYEAEYGNIRKKRGPLKPS
jgi:hypothetical protein